MVREIDARTGVVQDDDDGVVELDVLPRECGTQIVEMAELVKRIVDRDREIDPGDHPSCRRLGAVGKSRLDHIRQTILGYAEMLLVSEARLGTAELGAIGHQVVGAEQPESFRLHRRGVPLARS